MISAILFTQPDPHMGPAATDLFQVKGMTEIIVTVDGTEWRYQRPMSAAMRQKASTETEILLFRHDSAPLNLTAVSQVMAAAVTADGDGWIFWFDKAQCVHHDRCRMMGEARALIECHCVPAGGYEL